MRESCLIERIDAANGGLPEAINYVKERLEGIDGTSAGAPVKCERCWAVFHINPGGVYLEQEGNACFQPNGVRGMRGVPGDYQLNVDFRKLGK